jgi:biotin synthase-like enzyme
MSTQPKNKTKFARRTTESILAELILCKKLGWELGFVSGGHDAYSDVEFKELLKNINIVSGEKVWINIGAISDKELHQFKPYIKGVVASIETVNPDIHKKVCPSKPIKPFEDMLDSATKLGLKKAMTIILGLGETIDDFNLLKEFIQKHDIEKIHFYSLNPQKGTIFENAEMPTKEYQAEWIAMTRIAFPKINIQAGTWLDKVDNISLLLKAGANSISKFPAIKSFNSSYAKSVEEQSRQSGREFKGTLTKFIDFDIDEEVDKLNIEDKLKENIKIKLKPYIKTIKKNEKD